MRHASSMFPVQGLRFRIGRMGRCRGRNGECGVRILPNEAMFAPYIKGIGHGWSVQTATETTTDRTIRPGVQKKPWVSVFAGFAGLGDHPVQSHSNAEFGVRNAEARGRTRNPYLSPSSSLPFADERAGEGGVPEMRVVFGTIGIRWQRSRDFGDGSGWKYARCIEARFGFCRKYA